MPTLWAGYLKDAATVELERLTAIMANRFVD